MGFKKAQPQQAFLKMAMFGAPGAGKTLTALLIAEGLCERNGKRCAMIDTERGSDFYCQHVAERKIHPAAFDFDAIYTRSLTEITRDLRSIDLKQYGCVIIDSITHLWESAQAAYTGSKGPGGQIPMHAWTKIKKPYKELMQWLLNSPIHVIILGRQGAEFRDDPNTGEMVNTGYKMKAEGDTAYEPHIVLRLEALKGKRDKVAEHVAYVEKDRTGIHMGRTLTNLSFATIAEPLLGLLGDTQASVPNEDDAAIVDAEELARQSREQAKASTIRRDQFESRMKLANNVAELQSISQHVAAVKREMLPVDVEAIRVCYQTMFQRLRPDRSSTQSAPPAPATPPAPSPEELGDAWEGDHTLPV